MEGNKIKFRLIYRYPDVPSYAFKCESYNKITGEMDVLLESGEIVHYEPNEKNEKAYRFSLDQKDDWRNVPFKTTASGATMVYKDFEYFDEAAESHLIGSQKKANIKTRLLHGFLKQHSAVFVRGENGNNSNKNLNIAYCELIEVGENIRKESIKNQSITKYSSIVTDLYNDEAKEDQFIDLAWALDLGNVPKMLKEDIYNAMIMIIQINPNQFKNVYESSQKSLLTMIKKAINMPLANGETAIAIENGYYTMSGFTLGKTEEEVMAFFSANPSAMSTLEKKLGTYHKRPTLDKLPKAAPIDPEVVKEVESIEQTEELIKQKVKFIRTKVYQIVALYKKHNDDSKLAKSIEKIKLEYDGHESLIDELVTTFKNQIGGKDAK